MQLNVLMQNCGERRNNLIFYSEIYQKCDQVNALIQSWVFPRVWGTVWYVEYLPRNVWHRFGEEDFIQSYSFANLESFGLWVSYKSKYAGSGLNVYLVPCPVSQWLCWGRTQYEQEKDLVTLCSYGPPASRDIFQLQDFLCQKL